LKAFFRFLITRKFLLHFGGSILSVFLVFWLTSWYLDSTTKHGEDNYISVPNLYGKHMDDIDEILTAKGLELEISDSVYDDQKAKGTVILQKPGPTDSTSLYVKDGRTIYVTVVAKMPKMINVPNLVSKSKRHAEGICKIIGLKVKYKYKPDPDCRDCVKEQNYKGKPIKEGARLKKGETIELVLGQGSGGGLEPVPNLVGLTIDQANSRLGRVSLGLFVGSCEGCTTKKDSTLSIIYRQSPEGGGDTAAGGDITVWTSTDPDKKVDEEDNSIDARKDENE
jgi:eukaryotic-like serine/threonine-protein kinase